MSDNKWLNYNVNLLGKGVSLFNNIVKFNWNQIGLLSAFILKPTAFVADFEDWITTLFTNTNDWISGFWYYPFDVNYIPENIISGYNYKNKKLIFLKGVGLDSTINSTVDCESINAGYVSYATLGEHYVDAKFDNFADLNGYTSLKVYLPFYGFVDININDVLNKYIQFRIQFDFTTGQAQYYIGVSENSISHTYYPMASNDGLHDIRILSTHTFQIGKAIPLGSTNTTEIVRNIIMGGVKTVATIGASIATGISTPPSPSTSVSKTTWTKRNPKTGRQVTSRTKTIERQPSEGLDPIHSAYDRAREATFGFAIDALNNMHYSVNSDIANNTMLNCCGSRSIKVVYVRPKILPITSEYKHLYGQPLGEVRQISTLSGYTEISKVHFEGSGFDTCTSREYMMIEQAFSDGVLL